MKRLKKKQGKFSQQVLSIEENQSESNEDKINHYIKGKLIIDKRESVISYDRINRNKFRRVKLKNFSRTRYRIQKKIYPAHL